MSLPFCLRNIVATFQPCMHKCFKEQINRNLEVYVNDIMVKSQMAKQLIVGLEETFSNL